MAYIHSVCLFCLLMLISLPAYAAEQVLHLKQAVDLALEANPSLEAKLIAIDRAKMEVGVAQSNFWPRAAYVANWNKLDNDGGVGSAEDYSSRTRSHGLRVSLNLFSGLSHLNELQRSMIAVDVEAARHAQAKLDLIFNVQEQFLELLKARQDLKTVQESKKRIEAQVESSQAFVNVGMAPYLNVLQNEVELAKVKQEEIRVSNTIRNTEVALNKLLGFANTTRIRYEGLLTDFTGSESYDEEQAINLALVNRPDLIVAQKTIEMTVKGSHATAGRYLPSVSLNYDNMRFKRNYNDDAAGRDNYNRDYWTLGLNFTWEFFDGGNTTFSYLRDKKQAAALRKEYEDAVSSAVANVIQTRLDIEAARELIVASRKSVEAASESYAMANKRYQTNTGTITELIDAQYRLTEAEETHSLALKEYHAARAAMFHSIGQENPGLE